MSSIFHRGVCFQKDTKLEFFENYWRYFDQTFTNGHNFSFRTKHSGVNAPRPTVSGIAKFRSIFNALFDRVKTKFRRFWKRHKLCLGMDSKTCNFYLNPPPRVGIVPLSEESLPGLDPQPLVTSRGRRVTTTCPLHKSRALAISWPDPWKGGQ